MLRVSIAIHTPPVIALLRHTVKKILCFSPPMASPQTSISSQTNDEAPPTSQPVVQAKKTFQTKHVPYQTRCSEVIMQLADPVDHVILLPSPRFQSREEMDVRLLLKLWMPATRARWAKQLNDAYLEETVMPNVRKLLHRWAIHPVPNRIWVYEITQFNRSTFIYAILVCISER